MGTIRIPSTLQRACADGSRDDWLAQLPEVVATLQERWSLRTLAPFEPGGQCAWVAPAQRATGEAVVLKAGWPHPESDHEAAGLALWDGAGTVRLLETTTVGDTPALLLERCQPGTTLAQLAAPDDRDIIVAGMLERLWREPPAGHVFRSLQQMCDEWADGAQARLESATVADPEMVRAGLSLFRELPSTADADVVLFTDLHSENILSAEREPWLAIDPKPYVGDPCYDALQHMLNVTRLQQDPDGLIRRMADLAGLDPARLRLWCFARCAIEAIEDPDLYRIAERLAP